MLSQITMIQKEMDSLFNKKMVFILDADLPFLDHIIQQINYFLKNYHVSNGLTETFRSFFMWLFGEHITIFTRFLWYLWF